MGPSVRSSMRSLRARLRGSYGAWPHALKAAALLAPLVLTPQGARAEAVVAALGDSLTAGYGLPPEEGLVPRLQAWLDARGHDVRLVNAGVSGDTTAGGLARIDWTLTARGGRADRGAGGQRLPARDRPGRGAPPTSTPFSIAPTPRACRSC